MDNADNTKVTDNITQSVPEKTGRISRRIIVVALSLALFLIIGEYFAELAGLELRTFAQVIKGTCLWLVIPCTVLFAGNDLIVSFFRQKSSELEEADQEAYPKIGRVLNWMRRILLVILLLVILIASFFRALFYSFTEEMVTETMTPDGYIQGMWSSFLSETHYSYYVPVAGIFRKPFEGWPDEKLLSNVQKKYGADAEFVERQENGYCVFRIPDALEEGNYIYFHVSNSYGMASNALFQILLSEACHFWEQESRPVALSGDGSVALEDKLDMGQKIENLSELEGSFYITCYASELDITACAADLTDWLQFVKDTGQYPFGIEDGSDNLPGQFMIGYNTPAAVLYFVFNLTPLSDYMEEESWAVNYDRIRYELRETYQSYAAYWPSPSETAENSAMVPEEDADALFMASYDDSYEKECQLEDGAIRYRMVVRDAALGNRLYCLLKSTDNGETWEMINPDPFEKQMGAAVDFTFTDENSGTAKLMHYSENEADFYATEDGGQTYTKVSPDDEKTGP